MHLDDIDRHIIALLRRDGRSSYAALGRSVGLSESATRQRMQKLIEPGLLRVTCIVDPDWLGIYREATLCVRSKDDQESVAGEISALKGIEWLVLTTGSCDILARVSVENDNELLRIIKSVRRMRNVAHIEIFMHLKNVKHETRLPVRESVLAGNSIHEGERGGA